MHRSNSGTELVYTHLTLRSIARLVNECFCSINYYIVLPLMLLIIHSMHNQINVSTNESIFAFIKALRKGSSIQQGNTTA